MEHVVDANTGFVRRPGQETALAMPLGIPDELTVIDVDESALDTVTPLADSDGALRVTPTVSLSHRMLRSCLRAGADDLAVETAIGDVVSAALDAGGEPRYNRPSTR